MTDKSTLNLCDALIQIAKNIDHLNKNMNGVDANYSKYDIVKNHHDERVEQLEKMYKDTLVTLERISDVRGKDVPEQAVTTPIPSAGVSRSGCYGWGQDDQS